VIMVQIENGRWLALGRTRTERVGLMGVIWGL
jgi:hypothetical protein